MLDINFIRDNQNLVQEGARNKGVKIDMGRILELDTEQKDLRIKIEDLRRQSNEAATQRDIEKGKKIKQELADLEPKLKKIEKQFDNLMRQIPNPPAPDAPIGRDESGNVVIRKWGEPKKFDFEPRDHIELGKLNRMIDIQAAAEASGSRFYYLTGDAVKLELALVNFAIAKLLPKGFTPVIPPHFLTEKAMAGMGYLDHGGDRETYHFEKDNLYLIGTSEQAIGAMKMGQTIDEKDLPLYYAGFSPCYRREAGSYGKDTRGILRVHQFDKVEMFVFCLPEESEKEHQKLLAMEEEIMRELKLPYQVVNIYTGDLGASASQKFDIEAWIPSQGKYRETHSTSNCTDWQARRLGIRVKRNNGKAEFLHMLNGTAVAISRTLIAIMENYQTKDGKIETPEGLKRYILGK